METQAANHRGAKPASDAKTFFQNDELSFNQTLHFIKRANIFKRSLNLINTLNLGLNLIGPSNSFEFATFDRNKFHQRVGLSYREIKFKLLAQESSAHLPIKLKQRGLIFLALKSML